MSKWTSEQIGAQQGKVAIVTGANSGIGFEAARELARAGAKVILACRSPERGENALGRIRDEQPEADVHFLKLDLSDLAQVEGFAKAFAADHARLDVLVNNAGVMMPPESRTAQGFELQMGVNHFGHFALTGHLLPLLLNTPDARVVNVSSMAHRSGKMSFDDPNWKSRSYRKLASYGQSKLANLLFTFELQRRLEAAGSDVIATAAHPGWTSTNLQQHNGLFEALNPFFAMKAPQGALPTLRAATDPGADGGDYFGPDGFMEMKGYPVLVGSTKRARNPDDAAQLWDLSLQLTGVGYSALEAS